MSHSKSDYFESLRVHYKNQASILWRACEMEAVNAILQHVMGKERGQYVALDVGCGDGIVGSMLFRKLVGVDLEVPEVMPKNYLDMMVCNAEHLSDKVGVKSYSVVFANSVFEHMIGIAQVIREISLVLKKDGILVFTVPNHGLSAFLPHSPWYGALIDAKMRHYNIWEISVWRAVCKYYNLQIELAGYYMAERTVRLWNKALIMNKLGLKVSWNELKNAYEAETAGAIYGASVALVARKTEDS